MTYDNESSFATARESRRRLASEHELRITRLTLHQIQRRGAASHLLHGIRIGVEGCCGYGCGSCGNTPSTEWQAPLDDSLSASTADACRGVLGHRQSH